METSLQENMVAHQNIALLLAMLIGVSLGALGSGGSIVTLPILVYIAGVDPKSAVGMSMAIVGGTSFAGSYFHWRIGNFLPRPALIFGVTGIAGAYHGSAATHLVSSAVLMLLFAMLMLIVGARMLAGKGLPASPNAMCSVYRCVPSGFAVGLVTGFLGVGGGFVIVPALVWFAGLDAKRAIGTSLGIIAVNSAAGLAGQLRYTHWDWVLTCEFLVGALVGMGIGIPIARWAPERVLRQAFAIVVLGVAVAIAWQVIGPVKQANRSVDFRHSRSEAERQRALSNTNDSGVEIKLIVTPRQSLQTALSRQRLRAGVRDASIVREDLSCRKH
jgi:uncharacterized membrane protein YfcA